MDVETKTEREVVCPSVWPLRIQQKFQAALNLKRRYHYADFPELNGDAVFCGDCGKRGVTNPDNDLCVKCETAVRNHLKGQQ